MVWGRSKDNDAPEGYRRAKDGETPSMTLNGIPYIRSDNSDLDDGMFDGGDAGNKYYHDTFDADKRLRKNTSNRLRDAENVDALDSAKRESGASAISNQRSMEQSTKKEKTESGFTNAVKGKVNSNKDGKTKRGLLKKGGPIFAILAMVCGFSGISIMGQAALPVSLMNNLIDKFDSISVSNNRRTKSFLKYQTSTKSRSSIGADGTVNNYVKKRAKMFSVFSGNSDDYFKLTKRQEQKLKKQGITVSSDGNGNQIMNFTNTKGERMTIVADPSQADAANGRYFIDDAYNSDPDFRSSYFEGAKTWRGAVGAWFDKKTTQLLDFLGLKRSNLEKFKQGDDGDSSREKFQDTVADVAGDDGINGKIRSQEGEWDDDPDGDPDTDDGGYTPKDDGKGVKTDTTDDSYSAKDKESSKAATESAVTKKVDAIAGKVNKGVDLLCTASEVIGGISTVALIYQMAQTLKVASVFFEGIQKGQVESSEVSPMNEIGNLLTTRKAAEYEISDINGTILTPSQNLSGSEKIATKTVESNKSAMESAAVSGLYGNYIPSPADAGLQTFNLSKWLVSMGKSLGLSAASFKTCTYARLAAAAVDTAMDIYKIASCFLPPVAGCVGGLITEFTQQAGKIAFEVIKGAIKSVVISAMVPFFGNMLARGLATKAFGEDLGNSLVSGASMYMGRNHQYSGGSVADKKGYLAYLNEQDAVLAEKAQYERENLSPFDLSSQNTMMGSIYNKLIPIAAQTATITGGIKNVLGVVGSSFKSLLPAASAASNAITVDEIATYTSENCKDIDSIGGLADEFCNPLFITDVATIEEDPAQVIYDVDMNSGAFGDNFEDSDGDTPVIKEDSPLAKYIVYCDERESPFGIVDQNISNAVQDLTTNSSIGDGLVSSVPVVGGIIDGINSSKALLNYSYISGEACVTNNTAGTASVPSWDTAKNYQRFIEDQRLAESMGLIEKSAVATYLDKYYEKNPKDNSYEGILARYTGMTKENVIAVLDAIEGLEFLATYNPDGYAPYNYIAEEQEGVQVSIKNNTIFLGIDMQTKTIINTDRKFIRNFAC